MFSAPLPAHGDALIGNSLTDSVTQSSQLNMVNPPVNSAVHVHNQGTSSVFTPLISFKDVLAPPSPRTWKKSFEEVLNSIEELPEPTLLNGIPGIRFSDEVPHFVVIFSTLSGVGERLEFGVGYLYSDFEPFLVFIVCSLLVIRWFQTLAHTWFIFWLIILGRSLVGADTAADLTSVWIFLWWV